MQFDAGRGTNLRWSQIGLPTGSVKAIFLTHMHSDHSEGVIDILQNRWHFFPVAPKIDIVCSADAKSPLGFTMSCARFIAHIGDAFINSGEIAQRRAEDARRPEAGPAAIANVVTFEPPEEAAPVWLSGEVKVSAVRSTHVPGHASYRVDTPAGSVVVGGDAGNDTFAPPRPSSTSRQVEQMSKGADVIVHSAIHPVMGPERGSGFPPPIYFRQATASDLGAMAARAGAKHLVLTHLIPAPGAPVHIIWKVPGGGVGEADYGNAAKESGFAGGVTVARDLARIRLMNGKIGEDRIGGERR
jgi:ribonuclease Z